MLRTFIQIIAFLSLLGAMALVVIEPAAWPALAGAGLLVLGTLWERFYYRGGTVHGQGGQWQATSERFLDEESGGLVTVWFNPVTGERRYIDQGGAPPG
jgi:hypothetical protein